MMIDAIFQLSTELANGRREATILAEKLYAKYYRDNAPHFKVASDLPAILSQIDNMVAGLESRSMEYDRMKEQYTQSRDWYIEEKRLNDQLKARCDRLELEYMKQGRPKIPKDYAITRDNSLVVRVREGNQLRDRYFIREDVDYECWLEVDDLPTIKTILDVRRKVGF